MVYGPDLSKPVSEDTPLKAQSLPYALHQQEADHTVQARAKGMKCKTYILRSHVYAGATVQNYQLACCAAFPEAKAGWPSGFAGRINACRCGCLRAVITWNISFNLCTSMTLRG